MTTTIGYARRSREKDNGYSLDDQEAKIRAWAEYRDRSLTDVLREDDVSGAASPDARPMLGPALASLGKGDALVIAKFDRLSRSLFDFTGLLQRSKTEGWALICLDPEIDMTTASGRAMAGVLGVFAQLEREQLVERLHDARREKAKRGGYIGGHPFKGRKFGSTLETVDGVHEFVPVPEEREIIEDMVSLYGEGYTLQGIAEMLTRHGHPTVGGKAWAHQSVAAILRREGVEIRPRGRSGKRPIRAVRLLPGGGLKHMDGLEHLRYARLAELTVKATPEDYDQLQAETETRADG